MCTNRTKYITTQAIGTAASRSLDSKAGMRGRHRGRFRTGLYRICEKVGEDATQLPPELSGQSGGGSFDG